MTVTEMPKPTTEFDGAVRSTCKEATELLKTDQAIRVWFRPNGMISFDPDNDPAFVWLK